MSPSRPLVAFLGVAFLGIAGIGVGASATFSDAVNATQTITAGTLNMTVAGPGGSTTTGKTVTLGSVGPVSSTFTTGPQLVTTTNSGNIVASAILLSASDSNNNATLQSELYVRIDSWSEPNKGGSKVLVYDGTLAYLEAHPISIMGPIAAGATDPFEVTFYAGSGSAPSLSNASMGGVVTPTITVSYNG